MSETAGTYFEAVVTGFDPGGLGVVGLRMEDGAANIVMARRVTGILESPPASGIYTTTVLAPLTAGQYTLVWDGPVGGVTTFVADQFDVTAAGLVGYTSVANVQARAGSLLDDLEANPTQAELEGFIASVAHTLDGYLAGSGHAVPTLDPVAVAALEGVNTDGALVLALEARFPGSETLEALVGARARWAAALLALGKGTHPALVALSEDTSGLQAGSFFADEAQGYRVAALDPLRVWPRPLNLNTEPTIYEGMTL